MIDTHKIRKNLGSRDSIGLKREDVLELLAVHEEAVEKFELDNVELQYKGSKPAVWSWSDLAAKH